MFNAPSCLLPWSDPAPVQQAEPRGLSHTLLRSPGPGAPHHNVLHRPHTACWATLQHGRQILQVPLSSEDEVRETGKRRRRRVITGPVLQTDSRSEDRRIFCSLIFAVRSPLADFWDVIFLSYLTQISGFCSQALQAWKLHLASISGTFRLI